MDLIRDSSWEGLTGVEPGTELSLLDQPALAELFQGERLTAQLQRTEYILWNSRKINPFIATAVHFCLCNFIPRTVSRKGWAEQKCCFDVCCMRVPEAGRCTAAYKQIENTASEPVISCDVLRAGKGLMCASELWKFSMKSRMFPGKQETDRWIWKRKRR